MRPPTINELPEPPIGKSGFPWTEDSSSNLKVSYRDKSNLPSISIITPSFNQGQYLEETIRSVLLQGYSNLDYVVIDGGSTDNSVEIIAKYEKWLTYWESEPDLGQSHAINKGLEKTSGDWVNWLNSDDLLLPNALSQVASHAISTSSENNVLVFACQIVSYNRKDIMETWHPRIPKTVDSFLKNKNCPVIPQPSTFVRRDKMYVRNEYHYIMDLALYIQIEDIFPNTFQSIDIPIAAYRSHADTKTSTSAGRSPSETIHFLENYSFCTTGSRRKIENKIIKLKQSTTISSITQEKNRSARITKLLALLFDSPSSIVNRMFLGALKKEIFLPYSIKKRPYR